MLTDQHFNGLHDKSANRILFAVPGIAENIKRLRVARGFKRQQELAEKMGVPQSRVSDWERGRYKNPDLVSLVKVAKALGVHLDELINGFDLSYDAMASDLPRQTGTGTSDFQSPGESDVSATPSSPTARAVDEPGPMLNEIRDVRAALDESRDRIIAIETRLAETGASDRSEPADGGAREDRRPAAHSKEWLADERFRREYDRRSPEDQKVIDKFFETALKRTPRGSKRRTG